MKKSKKKKKNEKCHFYSLEILLYGCRSNEINTVILNEIPSVIHRIVDWDVKPQPTSYPNPGVP